MKSYNLVKWGEVLSSGSYAEDSARVDHIQGELDKLGFNINVKDADLGLGEIFAITVLAKGQQKDADFKAAFACIREYFPSQD